jgi:outer membrane protein assembly factor BamB
VEQPNAVGGLYALDAETGRLLWRTQLRGGGEFRPAVLGDVVYATSTATCAAAEGCSPELVAVRR